MKTTQKLLEAGQSVWYDNIQRGLLKNGELKRMIDQGEIRGVTSNPSIFMKAITGSQDYDDSLLPLLRSDLSSEEIFFRLAVEDIQEAADLFLPIYLQTGGGDGYVSLEVSPYLANDTDATLSQVQELWGRVSRPNLMVKIPATSAGLPAIRAAVALGININVTLIFSLQRYAEVLDAYMAGLEQRVLAGSTISSLGSVASFFVSRIDTKVDARLNEIIEAGGAQSETASALLGKAAIASARLAYADFKRAASGRRFQALEEQGARIQRPLWASTSTKNPAYRDVQYVEELIGPNTVNTVPPQTLEAFLDHGRVRLSLEEDLTGAQRVLDQLDDLGISIIPVTDELENEGVRLFSDAFDVLLAAIEGRKKSHIGA